MKSLGEERLQIKTHLALRADQSSPMVNEFARALLRKCSPPSESEAHAVGAKTGETFAPDGYAVSGKLLFLAAPHGSIYRDLFGPLLHAMIHCTAGIYFTRTLLIPAGWRVLNLQHIVLMYTISREEDDMAAETKTTTRPKRRVVAPAEKRIQVRLTVDSKFTKTHFNQLFAVLKIRNKNALAEHIVMNFKTTAAQTQILAFYNGPWLDIPFQSTDTSFVFPLTHEIADELEKVGGEILGGVNKSKTFRVMVAYFAAIYKLKMPVQSTFA